MLPPASTTRLVRPCVAALLALLTATLACGRQPEIPDETYRQAVSAFYVSLAAMQTSQDVIARIASRCDDQPVSLLSLVLLRAPPAQLSQI